MTKRRIHAEPRAWWRPVEEAQLRAQYPHMKTRVIAIMLGRALGTVYQRANKLGLTKSPEFNASPASGRTTGRQGIGSRFVKGQRSWNKGLRYAAGGRSQQTQFRKGQRSGKAAQNHMPIGSTRLIEGYVYGKVADVVNVPYTVNWKALHVLEWERANGPVNARTHAVIFRNKDRMDVRL